MTIAVDFDGTIVEHKYPAIGKQIPFAMEVLRALNDDGHKLILWTVREGKLLDEAVQFCKERGVEFYAVNSEYPNASWNGSGVTRKINADVYIDDSNIGGLPDWSEIYDMISHKRLVHHTHSHHSHHKKKKKNIFQRIVDKCRSARYKYNR